MDKDVIKAFQDVCAEVHLHNLACDGTYVYPNIREHVKHELRRNFNIDVDEEILYYHDTSSNNGSNIGFVITDDFWYLKTSEDQNPEDVYYCGWALVDHVDYSSECLYFYYTDGSDPFPIHVSHIADAYCEEDVKSYGNIFAYVLSSLANTCIVEEEDEDEALQHAADNFNEAIKFGDYDEAIRIGLEYNNEHNNSTFSQTIAHIYAYEKKMPQKAIEFLDDEIAEYSEDQIYARTKLAYIKYSILYVVEKEMLAARKSCLYVKNNAPSDLIVSDINVQEDATKDFQELEEYFKTNFLNQPYNERKLLVPVAKYTDLSQKTFSVVDMYNMPAIDMPMGHPIANHLYVGHPFTPSKYVPFEEYELAFAEDRVREFCQVMQSLGATEINIECLNSLENSSEINSHKNYGGGFGYKGVSISGNYSKDRKDNLWEELSHRLNLHQKFQPKGKPELPSNLVWYPNEPSWQRIYEQRIKGTLVEHEERIETKRSQVVQSSELSQIKAELQVIVANANINWEKSMDEKFEEHENAVLSIHVKFAPLNELNEVPCKKQISSEAKEYLEEVKACLADGGSITAMERRLLNKFRIQLGLSEEYAAQLESSLSSIQLTDDEKEYLEEYKACLADGGAITSGERRLLDRMMKAYGISSERAKEIENSVK